MKRLLILILLLSTFSAFSQQLNYDTIIGGWNAKVHLPADYYQSTNNYQTIIFFPGLDDIGDSIGMLLNKGPHKYLAAGWDGNVVIGGETVKFIIISLQPKLAYPNPAFVDHQIGLIKSRYRVRTNSLHLTGLSHGGWCWTDVCFR